MQHSVGTKDTIYTILYMYRGALVGTYSYPRVSK